MENQKKTVNKKLWLALALLVVAVAAALGLWYFNRPATVGGEKTITATVVADGSEEVFTITSEDKYLRGALESIDLIDGEEGEYGLFVTTVNGITADDSKQEWWCFTKGGQSLDTGVDSTPIADGDAFEITLTEGY